MPIAIVAILQRIKCGSFTSLQLELFGLPELSIEPVRWIFNHLKYWIWLSYQRSLWQIHRFVMFYAFWKLWTVFLVKIVFCLLLFIFTVFLSKIILCLSCFNPFTIRTILYIDPWIFLNLWWLNIGSLRIFLWIFFRSYSTFIRLLLEPTWNLIVSFNLNVIILSSHQDMQKYFFVLCEIYTRPCDDILPH
jgi:hypothetical protein